MRPRAGWPDPRRSKAVDNGGLRYGAVEGALRPPLPTATQSALHNPAILSRPSQAQNPHPLDQSAARETSSPDPRKRTLGGRLQIGIPAGFRSESVAGFLLEWVAGFVGIRRQLAEQRENRVEEGYLMPDHVHMLLSIPPKYAVSQVVGYIKGRSAIHLARVYGERKRGFVGQSFWARGYFVSNRRSRRNGYQGIYQESESEDQKLEQLNLWR